VTEVRLSVGEHVLCCTPRGLPTSFGEIAKHARLVEQLEVEARDLCCVTVQSVREPWPFLVIAQSFSPAGGGFELGAHFVPETRRLFVGIRERRCCGRIARTVLASATGHCPLNSPPRSGMLRAFETQASAGYSPAGARKRN
jgi:hypothetical protein